MNHIHAAVAPHYTMIEEECLQECAKVFPEVPQNPSTGKRETVTMDLDLLYHGEGFMVGTKDRAYDGNSGPRITKCKGLAPYTPVKWNSVVLDDEEDVLTSQCLHIDL